MSTLISVQQALQLTEENCPILDYEQILLKNALGFTLARDVLSPIPMPPFRQSAMDGYAITDCGLTTFTVIGEIAAGSSDNPTLKSTEAVRIFTGAAVPDDAVAVIPQEWVDRENDKIELTKSFSIEANIRPKAEQIEKGEIALKKGTKLNPAAIGFLSTLGITEVEVYKNPSIAVIITGDELILPGNELLHGQIYESNSEMIIAALKSFGFNQVEIIRLKDNFDATKQALSTAIKEKDLLIVSGGISVGDYDFVGKALNELKTNQVFYKVMQKPGKPLFFGKNMNCSIFALPGNPAAALTCFYIYVLPFLNKMTGQNFTGLPTYIGQLSKDLNLKSDRPQFLKAFVQNNKIEILGGQSSASLSSFATANALVFIQDPQQTFKAQQEISYYRLD